MGSDPGRLAGLRREEQLAALALERATGATARAHDVGGRQGAVDLLLTHHDGRTAAVEITSHAGPDVRRRAASGSRWPDSRRPWWTVERARAQGAESPGGASLADLPRVVDSLLAVPHLARRAAKVAAAGHDERHLFVVLGEGGVPDELYAALASPGAALPDVDPELPPGLTHLWLTTAWAGSPLVGWSRERGWRTYAVDR